MDLAVTAPLAALFCSPNGVDSTNPGNITFEVWIDSSAIAIDPLERYRIRIPKNSVALCAKFWCLSSTPTNGLVPVHN